MAIEVRIPTILRTYTDGEKAVSADGANLSALIDDLEANISTGHRMGFLTHLYDLRQHEKLEREVEAFLASSS